MAEAETRSVTTVLRETWALSDESVVKVGDELALALSEETTDFEKR